MSPRRRWIRELRWISGDRVVHVRSGDIAKRLSRPEMEGRKTTESEEQFNAGEDRCSRRGTAHRAETAATAGAAAALVRRRRGMRPRRPNEPCQEPELTRSTSSRRPIL